jgi:hypothetical protein
VNEALLTVKSLLAGLKTKEEDQILYPFGTL